MPTAIPTIGCLLTIALGALGLVAPHRTARLVGIHPLGADGTAEVRATYGGLFLGLGTAALLWAEPVGYAVAAAAWGGAAAARLLSLMAPPVEVRRQLLGLGLEAGIAAMLAAGVRW